MLCVVDEKEEEEDWRECEERNEILADDERARCETRIGSEGCWSRKLVSEDSVED